MKKGCTCNISDHEDREHRRGCRFFQSTQSDNLKRILEKHGFDIEVANKQFSGKDSFVDEILKLVEKEKREARVEELEKIIALDDGKRQLANVMLQVQVHIQDRIKELKEEK